MRKYRSLSQNLSKKIQLHLSNILQGLPKSILDSLERSIETLESLLGTSERLLETLAGVIK